LGGVIHGGSPAQPIHQIDRIGGVEHIAASRASAVVEFPFLLGGVDRLSIALLLGKEGQGLQSRRHQEWQGEDNGVGLTCNQARWPEAGCPEEVRPEDVCAAVAHRNHLHTVVAC
jgi:hypothetical protein